MIGNINLPKDITSTVVDLSEYDETLYWNYKTWNGFNNLSASQIWTDGDNIYYSNNWEQYILDKSTSTWNQVSASSYWHNNFYGSNVWTDGTNMYLSVNGYHYVLDKSNHSWVSKTWYGYSPDTSIMWTDGTNIYCSYGNVNDTDNHYTYILDKSTSTWSKKIWATDYWQIAGNYIWSDGVDCYLYYPGWSGDMVLNKSTDSWVSKTWNGRSYIEKYYIWKDFDNNIYYTYRYKLDKSTSTWNDINYSNYYGSANSNLSNNFNASCIWNMGNTTYYSNGSDYQMVLEKRYVKKY